MAEATGRKTSVLLIAAYNNPHVRQWYDALAQREELQVSRVCVAPLTQERLDLGWPEMRPDEPYLQPWRRPEDRKEYKRLLNEVDVVIGPPLFQFRSQLWNFLRRRLRGKPVISWSEPLLGRRRRPFFKYLSAYLMLKLADWDGVHLLSIGYQSAHDYYMIGIRHWHCRLFGFATEAVTDLDRDLTAPPRDGLHIMYCGGLVPIKRLELLTEALGRADLKERPWRLTFVGDGPERARVEADLERYGIADRTTITGIVPRDQVGRYMIQGDVLVLPSCFDGWGAVVNEAMEHGMAVIASDRVSAHMLVRHGTTGYVFQSNNVDELATCLQRLMDDPELVARMRVAAREQIKEMRPAAVAEKLARLCQGVAGHAPMPVFEEGLFSPIHPRRRGLRQYVKAWRGAYDDPLVSTPVGA